MSGDLYELARAQEQQGKNFVFSKKEYLRIPDSNAQNFSSSTVSFNLPTISTTDQWLSSRESSIEIPYTVTLTSTADLGADAENAYAIALKKGAHNVINGISVKYNNNTVITPTDLSNLYYDFKILSTFSNSEMEVLGDVLNFGKDSAETSTYQGTASIYGMGICDNKVTDTLVNTTGYEAVPGANKGLLRRLRKNMYAAQTQKALFTNNANMVSKKQSHMTVNTTLRSLTWNMQLTIPLWSIHDLFNKLPLVRNPFFNISLQVHSGNVSMPYVHGATSLGAATVSTQFGMFPVTVNEGGKALIGTADATITCYAAVGTANSVDNTLGKVCYFNACLYTMTAEAEKAYISKMTNQRVIYQDIKMKPYYGIAAGANLNEVLDTSISKLQGLLMITHLDRRVNGLLTPTTAAGAGWSQLNSPYSVGLNMPGTFWTQLQVKVSGKNVFPQAIDYSYDIFQQEIMKLGVNNNNMLGGFGSGLISQQDFENGPYGFVYVDLSRKIDENDYLMPRPVQITAKNSSLASVDVLTYLIYDNEFNIDCTTSAISL
jgi:hypothetical protein